MGNYLAIPSHKVKFNIKNIKLPPPPKLRLNWKTFYPHEELKIYKETSAKSKLFLNKFLFSSNFDPKKMLGKVDADVIKKLLNNFMEMMKSPQGGDAFSFKPERPMKFPYTFSAKIAQFPYKFYYDNNWMAKYYCYAVILCLPVFYKLERVSKSPASRKHWAEIQAKEAHEAHGHDD
ncbi:uncharacterized protein LOC108737651 [Agrilus planipennis]|uniref:Uncharacterized protein LOC108737651 n=1 Tax=Agrilus planipennis TaxID=224129 RepID=A0A1W4X146_AGRPL|nr:uncharacterized protein LOC108737651 [Agrilus planipennis]